MEKAYSPTTFEQHWSQRWEESGYYAPSGEGTPYCIMLPPPNITGSLHMGHAFQSTLIDMLMRYHRMQGADSLWQGGTDHAGIATQLVISNLLGKQGKECTDRETFLREAWRWKHSSSSTITRQLRRLGASVDWSRERFTLDAGLSSAVREVFVRLYNEGLIYRGQRLVNWDPVLRTAVSDLEVQPREQQGQLWYIRYPAATGPGVVVATTRPETLFGDVAVAVHPQDERYAGLSGQHLQLPLTDRHIPVLADEQVDREFGTGCVKITPAHDFNDYELGQRHALPMRNIFAPDASLNDQVPEAYRGMDRLVARERVIQELGRLNLLVRTEPHALTLPCGDRSGAVLEPMLTNQWFLRMQSLAEPAIQAVQDGRVRFVPEHWSRTYFEWMHNIRDWCISRQIWWGHRIPAWYDAAGKVYVGYDEQSVREHHGLKGELRQDEDVLDTWFSSALWPFSTLGWPQSSADLQRFYPTNVMVTGFDIIFFWVARMIMMGLKLTGEVPFREVYIHGLVRDADGNKMSKSRGNIIDPLDLIDGIELEALVQKRVTGLLRASDAEHIEQHTRRDFADGIAAYGTDALRFTFAAMATHGRDIRFDISRMEGYHNFCNKLWNATRFALLMVEREGGDGLAAVAPASVAERWIISRTGVAIQRITEAIGVYRFDLAAAEAHEFIWAEYCDWYVELTKSLCAHAAVPEQRQATLYSLLRVLESTLRMIHPIMPFVTEELWQRVAPMVGVSGATIMLSPWPRAADFPRDSAAEVELAWLKQAVSGLRQLRSMHNIPRSVRLPVYYREGDELEREWLTRHTLQLQDLARVAAPVEQGTGSAAVATALAGSMVLQVPLSGLLDKATEMHRLDRDITRHRKDFSRLESKLANADFVQRAPPEVVEKERQRCRDLGATLARLEVQRVEVESV